MSAAADAFILPGGIDLAGADWAGFVAALVLEALAGGAMGTVLGTAVPPNRISVAFALVLTPLIFTGASRGARSARVRASSRLD